MFGEFNIVILNDYSYHLFPLFQKNPILSFKKMNYTDLHIYGMIEETNNNQQFRDERDLSLILNYSNKITFTICPTPNARMPNYYLMESIHETANMFVFILPTIERSFIKISKIYKNYRNQSQMIFMFDRSQEEEVLNQWKNNIRKRFCFIYKQFQKIEICKEIFIDEKEEKREQEEQEKIKKEINKITNKSHNYFARKPIKDNKYFEEIVNSFDNDNNNTINSKIYFVNLSKLRNSYTSSPSSSTTQSIEEDKNIEEVRGILFEIGIFGIKYLYENENENKNNNNNNKKKELSEYLSFKKYL